MGNKHESQVVRAPHPRNAYFFDLLSEKRLDPHSVLNLANVSRQYLCDVRNGKDPVSLRVLFTVLSPFDRNCEEIINEWEKSRIIKPQSGPPKPQK